jgi:hypothetical protein
MTRLVVAAVVSCGIAAAGLAAGVDCSTVGLAGGMSMGVINSLGLIVPISWEKPGSIARWQPHLRIGPGDFGELQNILNPH